MICFSSFYLLNHFHISQLHMVEGKKTLACIIKMHADKYILLE